MQEVKKQQVGYNINFGEYLKKEHFKWLRILFTLTEGIFFASVINKKEQNTNCMHSTFVLLAVYHHLQYVLACACVYACVPCLTL